MLSEEEYPLLETKEMSDRRKELEKLNKENIIQKLVGTEETLKFYIDLYNKEKDKIRKTIEEIKDLLKQIDYHDIKDKNEREFYKTQYMQYVVARNILQGLLEDNV